MWSRHTDDVDYVITASTFWTVRAKLWNGGCKMVNGELRQLFMTIHCSRRCSQRDDKIILYLKITRRIEDSSVKYCFYYSEKQICNIVVLFITYIVVKPFWHWALLHLWLHPYYTWGRYYICGQSLITFEGVITFVVNPLLHLRALLHLWSIPYYTWGYY